MCDYCGCRDLEPIADLTEEHARIGSLSAHIRRALDEGDLAHAQHHVDALTVMLFAHIDHEETGLLPELAKDAAIAPAVERLKAEHEQMRSLLPAIDPADPSWAVRVTKILDDLDTHIWVEEYDIFPASIVGVTPEGWDRLTRDPAA